jgi:hypothetical protein
MGQTTYRGAKGKDLDVGALTADSVTLAGVSVVTALLLASGQVADLNGEAYGLILDADADTAMGASVDDIINIKIAGAEDFRFAANTLTALSGSTIEANTIAETTAASGVTVDGVLLKDAASYGLRAPQTLTASGAITVGTHGIVQLNHATVAIAATLAAPAAGADLLIVDNSSSGTAAHTVTLPAGVTWDGTNNTATLNAPGEALHVVALSATRWFIVDNIGSVGLSSV